MSATTQISTTVKARLVSGSLRPLRRQHRQRSVPDLARLLAECPLYRNDELGFWALSRWDDVKPALMDWETSRSGRGTTLEIIRAGVEIPPGILLFEDPPIHDAHRALLRRFSLRGACSTWSRSSGATVWSALDALLGRDEFDVIGEFGVEIPLRTIGFLFGIPESVQMAYRQRTDEALTTDGTPIAFDQSSFDEVLSVLAGYMEWRANNPSDDLMTELLNAEVDAPDGGAAVSPGTRSSPTPAWSPAPATKRQRASSASRCSCSPSIRTSVASSSTTRR